MMTYLLIIYHSTNIAISGRDIIKLFQADQSRFAIISSTINLRVQVGECLAALILGEHQVVPVSLIVPIPIEQMLSV